MSESRIWRVAVIGNYCTHGEFVVSALQAEPDVELVGGWEVDPRRTVGLATALGSDLAQSGEELLELPGVDVIAIACDPAGKAMWVERSAQAGKHLFVNKPMADSLDSARRIVAVVEEHGVQLVHDITAIRFDPAAARLLELHRRNEFGAALHYANSWGMTFPGRFPLSDVWPERLDPASRSGGGELTNMGCYSIDYMVALFGRPQTVQAKWRAQWPVYRDAGVESFGQIVADYGSFFAVLSAGKQTIPSFPELTVADALQRRYWWNTIELRTEQANIFLAPTTGVIIVDDAVVPLGVWLDGAPPSTPFRQLVGAIVSGKPPDSDARVGALGVEVLMAAYTSIMHGGQPVTLPLADGRNPLVGAPHSGSSRADPPH